MKPTILINPRGVKYAAAFADMHRIEYVEGKWDGHTLPRENEVITRPFLVDPETKEPIPVRVVEIQNRPENILVVVVTRDH